MAHQLHAFGGAEGGHVQMASGVCVDRKVALQLECFGQRGQALEAEAGAHGAFVHLPVAGQVGVVREDHHGHLAAQPGAVLQGEEHQPRVADGVLVIAEAHGSGLLLVVQFGELFALEALGDGAQRQQLHRVALGLAQQVADTRAVVGDGFGAGQHGHRGEATCSSGIEAVGDTGLPLFAGVAEVGAQIHPTGAGMRTIDLHHRGVATDDAFAYFLDAAIADQDVHDAVVVRTTGVHHLHLAKYDLVHRT
ncbi:MAG: hypothetical protein IPH60_01785 [Flavobacteriales bacterium]|nr:hypothetical protein [Flavobacteriales bacterium]